MTSVTTGLFVRPDFRFTQTIIIKGRCQTFTCSIIRGWRLKVRSSQQIDGGGELSEQR